MPYIYFCFQRNRKKGKVIWERRLISLSLKCVATELVYSQSQVFYFKVRKNHERFKSQRRTKKATVQLLIVS